MVEGLDQNQKRDIGGGGEIGGNGGGGRGSGDGSGDGGGGGDGSEGDGGGSRESRGGEGEDVLAPSARRLRNQGCGIRIHFGAEMSSLLYFFFPLSFFCPHLFDEFDEPRMDDRPFD